MIVLEPSKERLLTVREVADLIGVTDGRVYQLLWEGQMRGIRINRRAWLVPYSEAEKFRTPHNKVGRPRSKVPQVTK